MKIMTPHHGCAWITGASSGIGAALAVELASVAGKSLFRRVGKLICKPLRRSMAIFMALCVTSLTAPQWHK